MYAAVRLGCQFFSKPQGIKTLLFTGGSCATFSLFNKPTKTLIQNITAATPTKINLALGIGFLLLLSNGILAYKLYQEKKKPDNKAFEQTDENEDLQAQP